MSMRLKIHGCRGSFPVPTTPQRIEEIAQSIFELTKKEKGLDWPAFKEKLQNLARSNSQIYGGNTTCVELKSSKSTMPVFFDAGTGLTAASVDPESGLNSSAFKNHRGKAAIFFSHTHWDHIIGLPTLKQIFSLGNHIHLYGVHRRLEARLARLFHLSYFPVPYETVKRNFTVHQLPLKNEIKLGDLKIANHPQTHPGGSFAYRVIGDGSQFIFATDIELRFTGEIDPFYENSDLMILDAHFGESDYIEGFGHNSLKMAIEFAVAHKAKKLVLFHYNPTYSDSDLDVHETDAKKLHSELFKNSKMEIQLAYEGLELNL